MRTSPPICRWSPARQPLGLVALAAACSLALSACGLLSPAYVEPKYAPATPLAAGPGVTVAPAIDARPFTGASNRAPVPSVQGDPQDAELTARAIGRRPSGTGMLGANVTLPPGETVAGGVGRAVFAGVRLGGGGGGAAGAGAHDGASKTHLGVTIASFWLDLKPGPSPVAIIEYRARIDLMGDWPRFREGRQVEVRGTVSAGGLDNTLWRRAFDRALAAIATETARELQPGQTAR